VFVCVCFYLLFLFFWVGVSKNITAASLLLHLLHWSGHPSDLPDQVDEHVVDVDLLLGRGLHKGAAKSLRQRLALLIGDDALVLEVALVADEHHRYRLAVFDSQNLLSEIWQVVEGGLGDDGVGHREALAVFHVQVAHRSELFCACSVEDFEHELVSVDFQRLSVGVLNRRIILLDEDALDELHGERGLADATSTQHDNFVIWHSV